MVGGLLDHRVAGLGGNTTLIVVVTSHHDVAFEAPASTPAVCVVCVCVWICVVGEGGKEGEGGKSDIGTKASVVRVVTFDTKEGVVRA